MTERSIKHLNPYNESGLLDSMKLCTGDLQQSMAGSQLAKFTLSDKVSQNELKYSNLTMIGREDSRLG